MTDSMFDSMIHLFILPSPVTATVCWRTQQAMGIDDDMINAAENGKLAEVQQLIGRGANVNAKNEVCSRLNT